MTMSWSYLSAFGTGGKLDWGGDDSGNIPTAGKVDLRLIERSSRCYWRQKHGNRCASRLNTGVIHCSC